MASKSFKSPILSLSVSIAILTGCTLASSTTPPKADFSNVPSGVASVMPLLPGTPSTEQPGLSEPVSALFTAQAVVSGVPLAEYSVRIYNPYSRQLILDPDVKTDTEGKFSLDLSKASLGQPLLITVSKGNRTVEALLTSDRRLLGSTQLKTQAEGDTLNLNEVTTTLAKLAQSSFSFAQVMTSSESIIFANQVITRLAAFTIQITTSLNANPAYTERITSGTDSDTLTQTEREALANIVSSTTTAQQISDLLVGFMGEVATRLNTNNGILPEEQLTALSDDLQRIFILGTAFEASINSAGNSILLLNLSTGVTSNVLNTNLVPIFNTGGGGGGLDTTAGETPDPDATPTPTPDPDATPTPDPDATPTAVPTQMITGHIGDVDYRCIAGASVQLLVNGVVYATATTNVAGNYTFNIANFPTSGTVSISVTGATAVPPIQNYAAVLGTIGSINFSELLVSRITTFESTTVNLSAGGVSNVTGYVNFLSGVGSLTAGITAIQIPLATIAATYGFPAGTSGVTFASFGGSITGTSVGIIILPLSTDQIRPLNQNGGGATADVEGTTEIQEPIYPVGELVGTQDDGTNLTGLQDGDIVPCFLYQNGLGWQATTPARITRADSTMATHTLNKRLSAAGLENGRMALVAPISALGIYGGALPTVNQQSGGGVVVQF